MFKSVVISLGGSMLVPDKINIGYLKQFRKFIVKHCLNIKFYIVVGGGRTCRVYQEAARRCRKVNDNDLDLIGIRSTHLNAELVRSALGKICGKEIFLSPDDLPNEKKNVFVGGGWRPGSSTDLVAVYLTAKLKADVMINLSNVDYIYDRDPHRDRGTAKPIKRIDWKNFRIIMGTKWMPGSHKPFDPSACNLAERKKIKVVFLNGAKLRNLENFMHNRKFIGTEVI